MFEQIGTVIIVIVVLVVGAGLGLFAGFVLGRHKGQEMARGVKSEELEEAKTSLENARFENAELSARNAAAQAQIEGVNQQLAFAKSQLAQAQHCLLYTSEVETIKTTGDFPAKVALHPEITASFFVKVVAE